MSTEHSMPYKDFLDSGMVACKNCGSQVPSEGPGYWEGNMEEGISTECHTCHHTTILSPLILQVETFAPGEF